MLKILLLIITIVGVMLGSAYYHEKDIVASCAKYGFSTHSSFVQNIRCHPLPDDYNYPKHIDK